MNALTHRQAFFEPPFMPALSDQIQSVRVDEMRWGYILHRGANSQPNDVMPLVATFFSVAFGIAALATWMIPGVMFNGAAIGIKLALSTAMVAGTVCLRRYSRRAGYASVEIDVFKREIREIVTRCSGKAHVVSRYQFPDIGGVFIRRSRSSGDASLVLRYKKTSIGTEIASGSLWEMEALRDRIGHDLLANRP